MERNMLMNYTKMMMCALLLTAIQVSACAKQDVELPKTINETIGKEYPVYTAAEISTLKLLPGDKIILQPEDWKNQQINFKAKGTKENPITLTSANPGKIILSGYSNLKIDGEWLIVDGLAFAEGFSIKDDVIAFSKTSSNCRLTNTSVVDYNPSDKTKDYKWVSLHGTNNRVDHCTLSGKAHQGTTLVVWLAEQPNYHQIDHNYFGPRPALGVNGGETIRIGTSTWSMHDSYTKVENNVFDRCNGEMEIISNKSGHNTITNNLFYECEGTVTYRHGNNSEVSYNYFIGNNKKSTGGIRIIGENQNVHHNYLQGLTGTGSRAAISVMNAYENPELHEYYQVKNARIESNIIVDCAEAFELGSGKNAKGVVVPDGVKIANNYIINPTRLLVRTDIAKNLTIQNNQVQGATLETGFIAMGTDLVKTKDNIWQLKTDQKTPFWLSVPIGPSWKKPTIGN